MPAVLRLCLDLNIWCAAFLADRRGRQGTSAQMLTEAVRKALWLEPIAFRRAAKGTLGLGLPRPPVKLLLSGDALPTPERSSGFAKAGGDAIAPRWRK